ncbi:retron Ec48 family effector membrane protein [Pseudomonas chlororaphis]|uniref:retron Ec48 family effector membrane protein n=1 Tax=Pseudomonas chlororaphis TaxID=587753 RepID=UPI002D7729F8|nr:retron Ec48 family effector membrane protein [Pseudomonas chlororaphis]
MISKRTQSFKNHPALGVLVLTLGAVAACGFLLSLVIFLKTGFAESAFDKNLCFTNSCVKYGLSLYAQVLLILKETLNLLVTIATIGGIIVALLSYLNSVGATALSNHISHFSIFQSYIGNEISKRDRISASSVDIFLWYNAIFFKSRSGLTAISPDYVSLINSINNEIKKSNLQSEKGVDGSFRYRPHQERIIQSLKNIGIVLTHQPRNEFYEIEDQVFNLIATVNKSFCYSDQVPQILNRKYI